MLGVLVLQPLFDYTDEVTMEAFAFHTDWQYALDIRDQSDASMYVCERTLREYPKWAVESGAAGGGGVGGVPGEVSMAIGDRSDERAVETGPENWPPAGETVDAGASCGDVESLGLEHQAGGSGGSRLDFDRLGTSIDREGGKTPSGFRHSPVSQMDRRPNA